MLATRFLVIPRVLEHILGAAIDQISADGNVDDGAERAQHDTNIGHAQFVFLHRFCPLLYERTVNVAKFNVLTIVFDEPVSHVFAYSCGTSLSTIHFLTKVFIPDLVNTRRIILLSLIAVLKPFDREITFADKLVRQVFDLIHQSFQFIPFCQLDSPSRLLIIAELNPLFHRVFLAKSEKSLLTLIGNPDCNRQRLTIIASLAYIKDQ